MKLLPSRATVWALLAAAALALVARSLGMPGPWVAQAAAAMALLGLAAVLADLALTWRAWRRAPLTWRRELPHAFALGVPRAVEGWLVNPGAARWQVQLFDRADAETALEGLPLAVELRGGAEARLRYTVRPQRRGTARFEAADLRVRSLGGALELQWRVGSADSRPVLPDFAAVARYAWLAGNRRLPDIGIKTQARRGEGTDFKQLVDYRQGNAVRHIDWKATLRHDRPVVREYQDERDQCVIFLLDGGRRMRADDGRDGSGSHFDAALNALMLLAHVALRDGDEVGALTFGTAAAQRRAFAPRKGMATLAALTAALHDVQPEPRYSDYLMAARELMQLHPRRALVVVLTNFRDEDTPELHAALKLLRTRHLVLLASLRERVLRELAEQPLAQAHTAVDVAGAHLFAQARDDAFRRLAARDAFLVDAEPQQLAPALVNRYRAIKRAGLL